MTKSARLVVWSLFSLSLSCGGCEGSGSVGNNGDSNNGGVNNGDDNNGLPGNNSQCTDPTPCGNCDQDCRPGGNPFAPGASGGDTGFDGDACTTDTDCRGTCGAAGVCEGSGVGGFDGETCTADTDCRGICDGTNTCEGFGVGTGYDGDACQSDGDCRGTCGGTGVCEGSGSDGSGGFPGGGGTTPIGGGGDGGGDGTSQLVCLDIEARLEHAIPTVVLLIDRSGSMEEPFGNGLNRLEAAYNALMDPTDGLVHELQSGFRFGMSLFTSYTDNQTCPEISDVRPELNNFDPIDRVFGRAFPGGGTPTGEAIMGTLRQFDVHPDQGRKILLLATDGEPNTCPDPFNDVGQPEALAAVQQAYQQGIETIVLSVGDGIGMSHLEDMANAGAGLPIGGAQQAQYFQANDPATLKAEMRGIIASAHSCVFRVRGGVVDPALIDMATITLDGEVLTYGDPNGWNYHQDRKTCHGAKQCISLEGDACQRLQDGGTHVVDGEFLCTYYDPEDPPADGTNNGTGGGGTTPGPCLAPGNGCQYDGDCCSGVCGGGSCITQ